MSKLSWQHRIDYNWVVEFLESHSVLERVKLVLGAGGLLMLVNAVLMAVSPAGVDGPFATTVNTIAAVLGGAWALRWWLLPWPRRVEALTWVATIDVVVTLDSMLVRDRVLGAMGVLMLVATGTYVAVFHSRRALVLSVSWSVLSILVLAGLAVLGDGRWHGDVALGIALVVANIALIGVVLPTVQFSHWLLRMDAMSDPLTRLLNRRGLDAHWSRCVGWLSAGHGYAISLDLDRFKAVNDTFGHAFGDEVLKRAADRLRTAADTDTLIARTGGEEFVLVGRERDATARAVAERLRHAIETTPDLPLTVTVSVGVALFSGRHTADPTLRQEILRASDTAMYEAKHLGGNTVVVVDSTEQRAAAVPG